MLSAFGIVWFHVQARGGAVGYGGLVAFLTLSVWLAGRSQTPAMAAARKRVPRLLLPWMLWFVAYGLLNRAQGLDFLPLDRGWLAGLLVGPSIHLWYLPFIFCVLWALDGLRQALPQPLLAGLAGALTLGLVAGAPLWRPISLSWPYPYLQWADAAAPVAFGLFLACATSLPSVLRRGLTAAIVAAALLVGARNGIGISYALGFAACVVVASGRLQHWRLLPWRQVSEATFGVYLLHIGLYVMLLLLHGALSPEVMGFSVFGLSLLLVMGLRWAWPGLARHIC